MGHRLGWIVVACVFVVGMAVALRSSPPEPDVQPHGVATRAPDLAALGWQTVLNEDFTGSTLNTAIWQAESEESEQGDDGDSVVWTPDAIGLSSTCPGDSAGGCMTISTWTEGAKNFTGGLRSGTGNANPPFQDGFLTAFGYVEARINYQTQSGTNANFWMMSNTKGSPFGDPAAAGPEIDIAEHQNPSTEDKANTVNIALHWDGFTEHHKSAGKRATNPTSTPLQGHFHTYGLLWEPSGYRVFIDGNEVWQGSAGASYQLQHILLSSGVVGGTSFTGPVPEGGYGSKSETANKMIVDYVRVWQRPISDIPDQSTTAGTPLSVPFSVTDHYYQDRVRRDPGDVVVTATTRPEDQTLLPNSAIAVAGNGPTDPDGSFALGGFEAATDCAPLEPGCWFMSGQAAVSSEEKYTGGGSLRLDQTGGRVDQRIVGLLPQTTYAVDGWFDLTAPAGRLSIGVADTDTSLPGDQYARREMERNSWSTAYDAGWTHDTLTFTTGPDTTEVVLYIDNLEHAPSGWGAVTFVDELQVRSIGQPQRGLTVVPRAGMTGSAVVTLTARSVEPGAASRVLGTEAFTVNVSAGTMTNGSFESGTTGWQMGTGTVVREDRDPNTEDEDFLGNDVLRVARGQTVQAITGLTPQTIYVVWGRGLMENPTSGAGGFSVTDYDATRSDEPSVSYQFRTSSWANGAIMFQTGPGTTGATLLLADLSSGATRMDDLVVAPAGNSVVTPALPALSSINHWQMNASTSDAVVFATPQAPVARVRSDNPYLLPDSQSAVARSSDGTATAVSLAPIPGRAGLANIDLLSANGTVLHSVAVTVSDTRLRQGEFDAGATAWLRSATGALIVTASDLDVGAAGLLLAGSGQASQKVSNLEFDTNYVVAARVKGTVVIEIRDYDKTRADEPPITKTVQSTDWTTAYLPFTMPRDDYRCSSGTSTATVVLRSGAAGYSLVDDVAILDGPMIRPLAEWSTHQSGVADWTNEAQFTFGRLADSAGWDPNQVALSSSNPAVAPDASLGLAPVNPLWPNRWKISVGTDVGATGRSTIGVWLRDPATGAATARPVRLTVNAGTTFSNGDFENGTSGWTGDAGADFNVENKVTMQCKGTYIHPDWDQVLRVGAGTVRSEAAGLTPGARYVLQAWGRGGGAVVEVVNAAGDVLGSRPISSTAGNDLTPIAFTAPSGAEPVSVWMVIRNTDSAAGGAWVDDVGLFER